MRLLHAFNLVVCDFAADFAEQSVNKQPAAHTDTPVNPPHRQFDAASLKRLAPGQHVLVHAVHQRAVKIKQKCWRGDIRL